MYRTLENVQKKSASKLFQQTALLAVVGVGYQYMHGSFWDILLITGLALGFGYLSVDFLKGVKDNSINGGEND